MAYNIGLNIVEVDGKGSPAIVGAAVSVAAFNIVTHRGIPNTPVLVTSFSQFVERFGSFFPAGIGPYMVKGFFDNGGQNAYINRIIDTDPANGHSNASKILLDGSNNNTLTLESGYLGKDDPGTWGNGLRVKTQASFSASSRILETAHATIQGSVLTAPVDMSSLPSLSVSIDGETTPTLIQFLSADFVNATTATLEEIRNAVNKRTSKVTATLSQDNRLILTSTGEYAGLNDGWTSLQITVANPTLGFAVMANPTLGTAATIAAGGTRLKSIEDFKMGDAVKISDGTNTAYAKILSIDPMTNTVAWSPIIANPGSYTASQTFVKNVEFNLTLALGGAEAEYIVETWTGLSMEPDLINYAPAVLNDSISGSKYVTADDEDSASSSGLDIPADSDFIQFDPGRDGTPSAAHFAGDSAQHTGFYAFDPYDVQLVTCERTDPAVVTTGLAYCAGRGDCMYIGAVPEGYVEGGLAVNYGKMFQGKKVYGALYGPWIKILDPLGMGTAPYKFMNPSGHVMGIYARIETTRGIWKAPAGDEAVVFGALDLEHRLSDADHTNLVKTGCVNGIRAIPGAGIIVDASRTLSTDTRWLFVNVRLLFNYVKISLKQGLRWVRQEPNRDLLWNLVKYNSITPFLMGLWRQGAFGTGDPEDVFTVICDASNNPPAEVDKGNFKCEVYFYPSKPAETIIIIVGQQPSGAAASEV